MRKQGLPSDHWIDRFGEAFLENMQRFTFETPSRGYGDSGTRFKVFRWPLPTSTLREKLNEVTTDKLCPCSSSNRLPSPLQFRIVARHGTLKTHGRTESVWETDFPLRKGHNTFE